MQRQLQRWILTSISRYKKKRKTAKGKLKKEESLHTIVVMFALSDCVQHEFRRRQLLIVLRYDTGMTMVDDTKGFQ